MFVFSLSDVACCFQMSFSFSPPPPKHWLAVKNRVGVRAVGMAAVQQRVDKKLKFNNNILSRYSITSLFKDFGAIAFSFWFFLQ